MSRKSKAAEFQQEGYQVSITGRHVMVTEAMKDYALEKILKIEKFSDRIIDVDVIMDIQKYEHRVDIILKVNNLTIKSHAISDDMYASIDRAIDKIETQLRRYKSKLHDHQAKGIAAIDVNVNVLRVTPDEEIIDLNESVEEENKARLLDHYRPHKIVSKKTTPLKTLTDGEAIMKMELSGDNFLVYRAEEDRKLKIIYRRDDNDFGVIQPET